MNTHTNTVRDISACEYEDTYAIMPSVAKSHNLANSLLHCVQCGVKPAEHDDTTCKDGLSQCAKEMDEGDGLDTCLVESIHCEPNQGNVVT
ncbi:hypothetical protein AVEN_36150-1 [Araneus ventricosus]|uniref:Uncharacterized protein n=1 Tax=Araneus ventricosus TaxID=182803 RepID=A0A4Y2EJU3_ARAVE|nr:hypothetical protein AVEN_36150-1 [Araneus ventricosus]